MTAPYMTLGPVSEAPNIHITSTANGWIVNFKRPEKRDETSEMLSMLVPTLVAGEVIMKNNKKTMDDELESWKQRDESEKDKDLTEALVEAQSRVKKAMEKKEEGGPTNVTMVFEKENYKEMMTAIGTFLLQG